MSPSALGWVKAIALACAVLVLDQATKQIAVSQFSDGDVNVALGFSSSTCETTASRSASLEVVRHW